MQSIKAYLDFLRLMLTAVFGIFFIVFWDVMKNESLIKTMSGDAKLSVISIIIAVVILMGVIIIYYFKSMAELKKEP